MTDVTDTITGFIPTMVAVGITDRVARRMAPGQRRRIVRVARKPARKVVKRTVRKTVRRKTTRRGRR